MIESGWHQTQSLASAADVAIRHPQGANLAACIILLHGRHECTKFARI
jgi:hypothetical protein